jgi:hypothetical protein
MPTWDNDAAHNECLALAHEAARDHLPARIAGVYRPEVVRGEDGVFVPYCLGYRLVFSPASLFIYWAL